LPVDASAKDGLWRCTDGGVSWTGISTVKLADICFTSRRSGWGITTEGDLLQTTDGGVTWVAQQVEVKPETLYQIRFVDARHGFIAAGQYGEAHGGWVLATEDEGESWRSYKVADAPIRAVYFVDRRDGWAVGDQDIAHTTDGGKTWSVQLHRGNGEVAGSDVWFVDRRHGWAVSWTPGRILATDDGGARWRLAWEDGETELRAIRFANRSTGWAVGTRYPSEDAQVTEGESMPPAKGIILSTSDGGDTWEERAFEQTDGVFDLTVAGDESVVAVGEGWVLRRSLSH
jgi:photosystem II stability/assembly factor-like uncharacterized protein